LFQRNGVVFGSLQSGYAECSSDMDILIPLSREKCTDPLSTLFKRLSM